MNRREFLVRAGALAATPIVIQIVGCGSDSGGTPGPSTDRFTIQGAFTGGSGGSHEHTAEITCTQLNGGVDITVTSTTNLSHNHSVFVSASQLATVMSGGTVTVQTTSGGHGHQWSISRPAGRC